MKTTPSKQEDLEFYSKLFKSFPDPIVATDASLNITSYNKWAEDVFMWKPEEVIGKSIKTIAESIYPGLIENEVADTLFKNGAWKGEILTHRKNGERFSAFISINTMNDVAGKVTGTIAVIRDLSFQKKQEEEIKFLAADLKKANQQLEKKVLEKTVELTSIFETITDGVAAFDKDWNYTYVNTKGAEGVGSSPESLIGKNLWQIFPQLVGSSVHATYLKSAREQRVIRTIEYVEPFDKWFEGVMYPSPDGLVAYFQDVTDRKNAEIARDKSQELYRTIVETAQEGILQIDENNIITFANSYLASLLACSVGDLSGKDVLDIFGKYNIEVKLQNIKRKKEGITRQFELRILNLQGKAIDTLIQSSPLFNDGNYAGSVSTILDITERKQAEAGNVFKAELLNTIQQSVVATDENGVVTYWNKAAEKMYGWKAEDAVGKNIEDTTYSNKNQQEPVETIASLKQLPAQENEYWVNRKDGSVFPVFISNSPIYDSQNQLAGFIAISTDITERKKNEQQIIDSERKYRQIVETAQEGIWIMDENGITSFVNQKMCDLLEYTEEEIVGKTSLPFRKYQDHEAFFQRMEMRKQGKSETYETVFYSKSRKEIYTKISTNPFFDHAGNFIGTLAMVTDITGLKKAEDEKEFERRNKEAIINCTDDFIWSVTPDFKLIAGNKAFTNALQSSSGICLKPGDNLLSSLIFPTDFLQRWKTFYHRALVGESFKEEIFTPAVNQFPDTWAETSFNPIYKGGEVVGIACFSRNTTVRKIAEQKLKESEAHLAEAQRLSDMGSWNFDILSDKLTWSDQLYKIFDTDRETFDGTHTQFLKMIVEDDRELALQTSRHSQQTGEPFAITYRITTTTGEIRTIQEHGYGVKGNDGKVIRLFGTAQNITDRVQTEDENRFQARLLNTIGQAAVATDPNGVVSFWNKAAEVMYGWTAAEVIGKNIMDIIPTEQTREQSQQIMQQLFEGKSWEGEFIAQKKDGSTFPIFVIDVPLYDQQHHFKGVIGVSADITERKKAEHLLQVSEARYRKAQSLGKMGHWELNLKTNQLSWSDEVYNIFGVEKSVNKMNSDTYLNLVHPDDLEPFNIAMDNLFAGNNVDFSHRIIKKDGTICWVYGRGELVYNDQGEPMCLSGTVQDITQQKRSEIKLREAFVQQLLFASIVHSSNDAIISKTLDGIITSWNRGAETIFNYTEEEAIGKHIDIITPAELLIEQSHIIDQIKKGEHVQNYETERLTKNGMRIKVSLTISPIYNASGIVIGASKIARNITEQKKAAEDLMQTNKELHSLSAHLQNIREEERTHIAREIHDELGQQLSALKMDIEWLISKMPQKNRVMDEKVADLLTLIRQTVNSVRRISTNLRPAILDDLGLIAALEWQSCEAGKRSGIHINLTCNVTDVALPLPITTGLFRIYQEALTNVVRHSNAKHVNAEFNISNNMITLQITDDGKGIATEPGRKTFGLLGMKERAYILDGNIEIQSKPGKGTTITVSIPHPILK